MSEYLDGLNEPQLKAASELDGAVLVLAGAGTGKTRALTARLAHIINTGNAWPSQILAVTFTNKAASEMKQRVGALVGEAPSWLGTFHALATRMLRENADLVDGLSSNFTILDSDDQTRLVKQIMQGLDIDTKKMPPRVVASQISRYKDDGVLPQGVTQDAQIRNIYTIYRKRLLALNACDFGDLLLHVVGIFNRNPQVLARYHSKFSYILVDEYQDTNSVQYEWLKLLASGGANICCVGDDDQSIYGWRGAKVGNILKFEQDFAPAQVIRLEQNYRSTGNILSAASTLISNNKTRLGKELWSEDEKGEKVVVKEVSDGGSEARFVAQKALSLKQGGQGFDEMAVLVRAGFQTREFEEAFLCHSVPYKVIGWLKFYERAEIKDVIAYMRVVAQSADDLALERIINVPKRAIGASVMNALRDAAGERSMTLYDTCNRLCAGAGGLRPAAKASVSKLMTRFSDWRKMADDGASPADIAAKILDESGYMAMAKADKTPQGPGRVDNLGELLTSLEGFDTLGEFLEHVALVMDVEDGKTPQKSISIMTLHGAKGLEFNNVFLVGWEDGLFPSARSIEEGGENSLEEERRLAYVGLTRARKRAFVTHAQSRRIYGRWTDCIPSRFVGELPCDAVDGGKKVAPQSVNSVSFERGEAVIHPTFGQGIVTHCVGNKVDVAFDDGAQRRVIAGFLEAA